MCIDVLELRRKIEIANLAGITVSMNKQSTEFVIHIQGEQDMRMKSDKYAHITHNTQLIGERQLLTHSKCSIWSKTKTTYPYMEW